jgi:inositol phosphorylceramide mannosyltransferase catalytic subunit
MTPKQRMTDAITTARALVAKGDLVAAEALLASLTDDPAIRALGPQTTLGLPRRLQAVLLHLAKAKRDPLLRAGYQFHLVPPPDTLAPLFRYTPAEQRRLNTANRRPVPRSIHQIWIGPLPVPPSCTAWQTHAEATGYAYKLWREADLAALGLPANPTFAKMLARGDYPGTVDVARYAILAAMGGIYLDCDWYSARDDCAFHDLLPLTGLTALAEETPRNTGLGGLLLANSFIAAPPDHPAIHRLNAALPAALQALPDAPAWWSTGPLVFTLAARGGAVSIAPQTIVAGQLPQGAPFADVRAIRDTAEGLLIAWKSW